MSHSDWTTRPEGAREEVAAGGIVVRFKDGRPRIALIREDDFDQYCLPKGKVEKGETLEEAAMREIFEEAGLKKLTLVSKLGVRERLNFKRTAWKVTHYFLFTVGGWKKPDGPRRHEFHVEWFPPDKLPPMFWPEQEELARLAAPEIKKLRPAED